MANTIIEPDSAPTTGRSTSGILFPALVAAALLGVYITVWILEDGFHLPSFYYKDNPGFHLYQIPFPFLKSIVWKIVLVFPATIFGTVALVRAGVHVRVPQIPRSRVAVLAIAAGAAVVLAVSTQVVFHGTETTDDENTYEFEARTLLAGRIANAPPPVRESVNNDFIINDGKHWVGKYPLGQPLVLAAGMALGSPFIAIIAVSCATLVMLYLIALKLYDDRKIALLTVALGAVSPFFYMVSSTRLSHPTTAFFLAVFIYLFLVARDLDRPSLKRIGVVLTAGFCLGYAFNMRPLTAIGFAAPFAVLVMYDMVRRRSGAVWTPVLLTAGFAVVLALTLWYNALITGDPLGFPFSYYDPNDHIGFGPGGHTFGNAIHNVGLDIVRVNSALFGFPVSLIFVAVMVIARKNSGDRMMFGVIGGIVIAYLFYFSPGVNDVGPVYYYELIIPLLILSARGIAVLHRWLSPQVAGGGAVVPSFFALSILCSIVFYVPEQVQHIQGLTDTIREPYEIVRNANIHNALVLVRIRPRGWVFGRRNPSPDLNDDVLYFKCCEPQQNVDIINQYAGRTPYLLGTDSKTLKPRLWKIDPATSQFTPM